MVYPEPVELVIVKKEIDETRKHLRSINQMVLIAVTKLVL